MEQIKHAEPSHGAPPEPIKSEKTAQSTNGVGAARRPLIKERRSPTPRNGAAIVTMPRNGTLASGPVRRRPMPRSPMVPARSGGPLSVRGIVVVALIALGLGIFAGVSVSRSRQRKREVLVAVTPPAVAKVANNTANITIGDLLHQLEQMQTLVPRPPGKGAYISRDGKSSFDPVQAGPIGMRALITQAQRLQFLRMQKPSPMPNNAAVEQGFTLASRVPGYLESLSQSGQSPEEARFNLRLRMAQEKMLIGPIVGKDQHGKEHKLEAIQVSRAEAATYWAKNEETQFYTPETARAQVIVAKTQAQIERALDRLNHGVPMGQVAQDNPAITGVTQDGMLPLLHRGHKEFDAVTGLEDQIFKLKPTQSVGPIQLPIGGEEYWWIIKCTDHQPARVDPFPEVQDVCTTMVALSKVTPIRAEVLDQNFAEFRRKVNLTSYSDNLYYKDLVDRIRSEQRGQ